jgi:hypothetical protein
VCVYAFLGSSGPRVLALCFPCVWFPWALINRLPIHTSRASMMSTQMKTEKRVTERSCIAQYCGRAYRVCGWWLQFKPQKRWNDRKLTKGWGCYATWTALSHVLVSFFFSTQSWQNFLKYFCTNNLYRDLTSVFFLHFIGFLDHIL